MKINDIINDTIAKLYDKDMTNAIHAYKETNWFKNDMFLYRGLKSKTFKTLNIPNVGIRNNPKDTPVRIHNSVNDISMNKIGINIRNGVFSIFDREIASYYGYSVHIVIPTKDTKMFMNKNVKDFTSHIMLASESKHLFNKYLTDVLKTEPLTRDDEINGFFKHKHYNSFMEYTYELYVYGCENISVNDASINQFSQNEVMVFGECYIVPEWEVKHILGYKDEN
jgi:hypothetical protein